MPTADAREVGWTIVVAELIVSGANDIVHPEIFGRVRLPESRPLLQGAPVVMLGIAQFAVGILLLYRQRFRRQT